MNMIDPVLAELAHEAATTRRLLERLPQAHLAWKPHEKSMTLGRLAGHIAEIPVRISSILEPDEYDFATGGMTPYTASSVADLLTFFDQSVSQATALLKKQTNDRLLATWRLKRAGKLLLEMPRMGAVRAVLMIVSIVRSRKSSLTTISRTTFRSSVVAYSWPRNISVRPR